MLGGALDCNANYCRGDLAINTCWPFTISSTNLNPTFNTTTDVPWSIPTASDYTIVAGGNYRFFCYVIGFYHKETISNVGKWVCDGLVCRQESSTSAAKLYVHVHSGSIPQGKSQGDVSDYGTGKVITFYDKGNDKNLTDDSGASMLTLTALYFSDFSLVSFDPNGGSWKSGSTIQNPRPCFVGDPVGELPTYNDVLKQGQILKGWYYGGDYKVKATDPVPHGDFSLDAHWQDPYYVYLNSHGGYLPEEDRVKEVFEEFPYGALKPLPTPVRAGYVFRGWYTQETGGERITDNTTVEPLTDDSSSDS